LFSSPISPETLRAFVEADVRLPSNQPTLHTPIGMAAD
jgi:hypothetical protein